VVQLERPVAKVSVPSTLLNVGHCTECGELCPESIPTEDVIATPPTAAENPASIQWDLSVLALRVT